MAFPIAGAIAGATLAISAGKNFFGGGGNRRRTQEALGNIEALRPRIRSAGAEATGAARESIDAFREFDALGGFDEELAARTRAPLEAVRERSNAAGRFRSGRAEQEEQEVIGREAATLLTARQRLQLSRAEGLGGAAANFGNISLDFLGAESDLESGLAEFGAAQGARSNRELFDAFRLFLSTQNVGK